MHLFTCIRFVFLHRYQQKQRGPTDAAKPERVPLMGQKEELQGSLVPNLSPGLNIEKTRTDVLNKGHNRQIRENGEYFKTIDEVLLLTATQNMA